MPRQSTERELSCADCQIKSCRGASGKYPAFCPTKNMMDGMLEEDLTTLRNPEDNRISVTAAEVEYEGYGKWCRVEDTIAFTQKLGVTRIGIATCVGLLNKARVLTSVLRKRGFEVYTFSCKVGAVPKTEIGIAQCCDLCGVNMCDPVPQAKLLNEKKTQLNIVFLALCGL